MFQVYSIAPVGREWQMRSFNPVIAAVRALDVLQAVNRLKLASVGDIFRETGLNRPTVVRMLETLIHAGFVARHPTQPLYAPTGKTLELSSGYEKHREMGLVATPVLMRLRQSIRWPSDVAVFDGDAMVVAETSREAGRLSFNRRPGYRAPILGSSLGLSYLAFCSEHDRRHAIAAVSQSSDPWNAIARDADALARLLAAIRRDGYATMHEAYSRLAYDGIASAIGVPVLVGDVAVGSLNMMFLRDTLDGVQAVARFLDPLRGAAAEVAQGLRHDSPVRTRS